MDPQRIKDIKALKAYYLSKKEEIEARLKDFEKVWDEDDAKIFSELCFCILTPQSKAEVCDTIIKSLEKDDLLRKGRMCQIRPYLKKARFYRNKSRYILEARKLLSVGKNIRLKERLNPKDIKATRQWLVENIKGIGYKEASHFLRNIGFGGDLAILDVHILRSLKKFSVIKDIPKTLTKRIYLEIEEKVRDFSKETGVPASHLDLLFWSMGAGKIFK